MSTSRFLLEIKFNFTNFISKNKIQNILNEEDSGLIFEKKAIDQKFGKTETERKTYESMGDLKSPPEIDSDFPTVINLDDSSEKEKSDPRNQAMFKLSRHSNPSIFLTS